MNTAAAALTAETNAKPAPGSILEVRDLCEGKRVTMREADAAVAELGEGWRLETPHEAFAAIDYSAKNAHGAISQDEDRTPDPYWTCQPYPLGPSARVVVWFDDGVVSYDYGFVVSGSRARARAVRVAGQFSDI